ncbi:MAG: hypothetical protein KKE51_16825 [Gammaproteobacteria bacterium]|nr:hypothetical protein [Gammaproteobacteria bacterium]MBU1603042.1 hypothetical protein [Gammaproteobacteria bacterium]MBU2432074.1 hypothetical protein [Gammaproteobacteria bacterium]
MALAEQKSEWFSVIAPAILGSPTTILITSGAGFIGCSFVLDWLAKSAETVINLDDLTNVGILEANFASATITRPVQCEVFMQQLVL